jgi:hypothetical protein
VKWLRQLRIWWKRRKHQAATALPSVTLTICKDIEARVVQHELNKNWYCVEYRKPESGMWIRVTRAYTETENPIHWSLTYPWIFRDYEAASCVADAMTREWLLGHLTADRERYHDLRAKRLEELKARRKRFSKE